MKGPERGLSGGEETGTPGLEPRCHLMGNRECLVLTGDRVRLAFERDYFVKVLLFAFYT